MNDITLIKQRIQENLQALNQLDFSSQAVALFTTLGYDTSRQAPFPQKNWQFFKDTFLQPDSRFNENKAQVNEWQSVDLLFQLSQAELSGQVGLFENKRVNNTIIESYLFLAIELKSADYSRTALAQITREVNKVFPMPVMVLFKYGPVATLAVINRRLHKRDEQKDVLEKVTVIKDISLVNPHCVHIEILFDLSLGRLKQVHPFTNFVELHNAWQKVLSTSELNRQFYLAVATLFTELAGGERQIGIQRISKTGLLRLPSVTDDNLRKEFAVRLIGRLLFCWFLKKKTSPNGVPLIPDEILSTQGLKSYAGYDYYHSVLEPLFFEVLNKRQVDRSAQVQADRWNLIPFLNGGLFEPHSNDYYELDCQNQTRHLNTLQIPDTWFEQLFNVFERYHFTIEENTPIEVEVSIDPEMLGQIFENLLAEINPETGETARKVTGSYYTPRPIVDYMVTDALRQYLLTETSLTAESVNMLLSYDTTEMQLAEADRKAIIKALDNLKILDPACGSGAFPMGILQKILLVLQKVDPDSSRWLKNLLANIPDPAVRQVIQHKLEGQRGLWDYTRKFGIIRNSIYGVDIQPIATEISKLRCFLSLIVDEEVKDEVDNRGIMALPNLEFKFVCADALTGLPKTNKPQLFESTDDIESLKLLRTEYFSSYGPEKEAIKTRFKALQGQMLQRAIGWHGTDTETLHLSTWDPFSNEPSTWFDPEWMFGVTTGFHLVIGNPPYIRVQNLLADKKQQYQKSYKSATSNYDIYVIFVERGLNLLHRQGQLAYILPHKFFNAKYGAGLRQLISQGKHLRHVVHFGGHQIFQGATNYTCLLFLQQTAQPAFRFVQVDDLNAWYETYRGFETEIPAERVGAGEWNFVVGKEGNILEQLNSMPTKLEDVTRRIFQGLKTSADKIYIVEEVKREKNRVMIYSAHNKQEYWLEPDLLHPLIKGGDSKAYQISSTNRLILFPYASQNNGKVTLIPEQTFRRSYPLAWAYLLDNKTYLENREHGKMQGIDWYAYGRNQALYVISLPKIFTPDIALKASFSFDETGELFFTGGVAGGYGILVKPGYSAKYILALLNSKVLDWFIKQTATQMRGGYYSFESRYTHSLPIYAMDSSNPNDVAAHEQIVTLVDYIIYLKKQPVYQDDNLSYARNRLMVSFFEQIIDGLVYELYFPAEIQAAGCQVFKHLTNLPKLQDDWNDEKKLATIEQVYQELSHRTHLVSIAIFKMETIEEIRIIEGKG